MDLLIFIIIWYLIGFLICMLLEYIEGNSTDVQALIVIFALSFLGAILFPFMLYYITSYSSIKNKVLFQLRKPEK